MATLATTVPAPRIRQVKKVGIWTPAYTLWLREIVRFYRQKARVVGVIASPLLFWFVLGSGFGRSFHGGAGSGQYLEYFFPGAVVMIVLFTAIFSMMSLIQDRNEGFLLSVLAAPVSRSSIVLGKVLGGATLAAIQGIVFLVFTPLIGVHPDSASHRHQRLNDPHDQLRADSSRLRHRMAHGFAAGLPRYREPDPAAALDALRRALPRQRSVRLAAHHHATQSPDLRSRRAAHRALPCTAHRVFTDHKSGRNDCLLRADLRRIVGHRQPPNQ